MANAPRVSVARAVRLWLPAARGPTGISRRLGVGGQQGGAVVGGDALNAISTEVLGRKGKDHGGLAGLRPQRGAGQGHQTCEPQRFGPLGPSLAAVLGQDAFAHPFVGTHMHLTPQ